MPHALAVSPSLTLATSETTWPGATLSGVAVAESTTGALLPHALAVTSTVFGALA